MSGLWTSAVVAYGLAGCLSAGVAASCLARSRTVDTAWVLAALLGLTLHYAGMGIDAALHADRTGVAQLTVWAAFGQVGLVATFISLTLFLLGVVTRVMRPQRPPAFTRWCVWGAAAGAALFAAADVARVVRDFASQSPESELQRHLAAVISGDSSAVAPLFALGTSAVFRHLFSRVPLADRAPWMRWVSGTAANRSDQSALSASEPVRADQFGALSGIYAFTVLLILLRLAEILARHRPAATGLVIGLRLLCLPSVVAVLYFSARPVFFDVVLKQGALFLSLGVVTGFLVWAVSAVTSPPVSGLALAGSTLALTAIGYGASFAIRHIDSWLDRRIFGHRDHARDLSALVLEMAGSSDLDTLRATVARHVGHTLDAEWVRLSADPCEGSIVTVGIGTPQRPSGYLAVGPRRWGHRYGAADLAFLEAVAGHYLGVLEASHARTAQHNATVAELRALRAQINPHFLFNALNLLAEKTRGGGAEHLVLNLAEIFRFALESTQRETVPLGAELRAIRAYLEIQAERFGTRLQWSIDVAEHLLETPIPPMMLQPLVENAVTHGIGGKADGGIVRVVAGQAGSRLQLTVVDDGVGFTPGMTPERVGLANVRARVEYAGGAWHLHAAPGAGTMITMEVGGR